MSHYDDAICAADLDGGDCVPTDECIDCGAEIVIGFLRCTECEVKHEQREEFETNGVDPRR